MNRAIAITLCLAAILLRGCAAEEQEPTAELRWGVGYDEGLRRSVMNPQRRPELLAETDDRYKDAGITDSTIQGCIDYFKRSLTAGIEAGYQDGIGR